MTDSQTARWEIRATLARRGFSSTVARPSVYRGPLRAGHTEIEIEIEIADVHFSAFPKITVVDRSSLPVSLLAHLEQGTGLCYADGSLLILDRYRPGESLLRILEEAEKAVARSLAGNAAIEISREYPRYWGGDELQVLIADHKPIDRAKLGLPKDSKSHSNSLLLQEVKTVPYGYKEGRRALVVGSRADLRPLAKQISPQKLSEMQAWHLHQPGLPPNSFRDVQTALLREELVFYHGGNGWIGCQIQLPPRLRALRDRGNPRPEFLQKELLKAQSEVALTKYCGKDASLAFVTARNLEPVTSPLSNRRIVVVGCGSVGSHLARFLVQSGAGNGVPLALIDPELLASANLGRHLLNFEDVGRPKAEALSNVLRRFHPDVQTTPMVSKVEIVWNAISNFDLIVDATGMEATSTFMNAKALEQRQDGKNCNLLHVWLFANGIAARSFLNVGDGHACYRCLRPNLDEPWIDDPRKDVTGQVLINPAHCGDGPYVPFSVSAPVNAGALALSAILDFFSDRIGHRMRSHLLDSKNAREVRDKSPTARENCPACSPRPIVG